MSSVSKVRKGFTLVEILIVVVILGILAAIVIPQFTKASEAAQGSNLVSQLQTIRSQLELYQVQHNGDYPAAGVRATDGTADWDAFTIKTNKDGSLNAATGLFGPYMQKAPSNPFMTEALKTVVATNGSGGWEYTAATGQIRAVVPSAAKAVDAGLINAEADLTATHADFVVSTATP